MPHIDKFYKEYGKTHFSKFFDFSIQEYERITKKFNWLYKSFLPCDNSIKILDIGCGGGHFLYFLKKNGYTNLSGIDLSPDQVEVSSKITPNVYHTDAFSFLDGKKEEYDLIIANNIIEHMSVENALSFSKAIHNCLKSGGVAIVATPNACTPWSGYNLYIDITHHRLYTQETLTQILSGSFSEIKVYPGGPAPYDLLTTIRWALWKIRETFLKFNYAVDMGPGRAKQKNIIVSQELIAVCKK